jgi:nucleotide-binding universal stress UspA family protein
VSISGEEHLPYHAASLSEAKGTKEQIDEHFRTLTKQARDLAALSGVTLEALVQQGHEVERIIAAVKDGNFDLLVIRDHGHGQIFERTMGSTAQSIVRHAPSPVLVAK